ncbi:MAG: hypothetical protein IJ860_09225 [Eubacterium sp.]|nr:hypothetical protein [Eubacterium sp.]
MADFVEELIQAIRPKPEKNQVYDAVVSNIDDDGVVWVYVAGSDRETPTASSASEVKRGDAVKVEWRNNKLYIAGNYSNPAAGTTRVQKAETDAAFAFSAAQNAQQSADTAAASANQAIGDAARAKAAADQAQADASAAGRAAANAQTAANNAQASADDAQTSADNAQASADNAQRSANAANTAANGAVTSLGLVQGVVDQLEIDMDDMQTHVAMMDAITDPETGEVLVPAGLHITPSGLGYFLVASNDGVYVYDNESALVATFGENIDFSSGRPQRIGGEDAYIEYYDSNNDGVADSMRIVGAQITFAGGRTADQVISAADAASSAVGQMQQRMDSGEFRGEDATVLRIDSSRGTVFKNNAVSTVLTVTVYSGGDRITNITDLRAKYGAGAYLQWYWQRLDDSDYGVIVASDQKLSNNGFSLTLTPEEVDVKVTFRCELITE